MHKDTFERCRDMYFEAKLGKTWMGLLITLYFQDCVNFFFGSRHFFFSTKSPIFLFLLMVSFKKLTSFATFYCQWKNNLYLQEELVKDHLDFKLLQDNLVTKAIKLLWEISADLYEIKYCTLSELIYFKVF